MRTPISYTLAWPSRIETPSKRLDLGAISTLRFEPPDETRFPALRLAREALNSGGAAATVLNAANEVAVEAFCERQLSYLGITETVAAVMAAHDLVAQPAMGEILEADSWARKAAENLVLDA